MCTILPHYLSKIATSIKVNNKSITCNLICKCGNQNFFIFKNDETTEELLKKQKWESILKEYNGGGYSDSEGNLFLVKKFLGFEIKKIKIKKSEMPHYTTIFKVQCSKCKNEYIIFDSRKNGYDAIAEYDGKLKTNDLPIKFNKYINDEQFIGIKITNDLSYEDFKNEFENLNKEDYSNAFSEISIYSTRDNKTKCIYYHETR